MTPRQQLADALAGHLPTYRVIGYSKALDRVDDRTLLVWTDRLDPEDSLGRDGVRITLVVVVLTPYQDIANAETDLDEALADVLAVLHPLSWVAWTDAQRDTFGDQYWHGYKITLTAVGAVTPLEA